ncbi:MAG: hypothetical protein JOY78_04860 [Pseudonocardia sp.]|nr:hypothetical protein [Pseudonocardia sp.]
MKLLVLSIGNTTSGIPISSFNGDFQRMKQRGCNAMNSSPTDDSGRNPHLSAVATGRAGPAGVTPCYSADRPLGGVGSADARADTISASRPTSAVWGFDLGHDDQHSSSEWRSSSGCLPPEASDHGRGSPAVRGSGRGVARPRRGAAGIEDTTLGSSRDDSVRSISAIRTGSAKPSMGDVITRFDGAAQIGHAIVPGAVPIGRRTSTGPSIAQR